MLFIQTKRLKLLPLTHSQLQLCAQHRSLLEESLGLTPSNMQVEEIYRNEHEDALQNFWLPNTLQYPETYFWYTSWEMILVSQNLSIGGIGFAGAPNEQGETMIGYMVDGAYHQQGFATEALQAMAEWYFLQPSAKTLVATTNEGNIPSAKTLERCHFTFEKTEDGLWYYHRS
jgi:[ribosomal protein S5]-alanine N-acetyltransferase